MLGPFAITSRLMPVHQVSPLYCRTPPAHRCPRRRQRQRVTEGTVMAPWNGPNNVTTLWKWAYDRMCRYLGYLPKSDPANSTDEDQRGYGKCVLHFGRRRQ